MGRQRREISGDVLGVLLIAWALLSEKQQHPKDHAVIWTELLTAECLPLWQGTQLSPTREMVYPHFIRLDVFHPVLRTALQKSLQAYFPRSAWGILRQEHEFSELSPPWVQAVGHTLGFAILLPSAIPQAAAQHVPSRSTAS